MINKKIKAKNFTGIKLLALDFDGVMTNDKVYIDEEGVEMVRCSRADGLGIELLKKKGIDILVISKESNKVVKARCKKLKIQCLHGENNKLGALRRGLAEKRIPRNHVCYIGNDISDYECIKYAGIGVAVKESQGVLLKVADFVTRKRGGEGAVREICDKICGKI